MNENDGTVDIVLCSHYQYSDMVLFKIDVSNKHIKLRKKCFTMHGMRILIVGLMTVNGKRGLLKLHKSKLTKNVRVSGTCIASSQKRIFSHLLSRR